MNAQVRAVAFAAVVVVVFAAALALGRLVGPLDVDTDVDADVDTDAAAHADAPAHTDDHGSESDPAPAVGLAASTDGYLLTLGSDRLRAGSRELEFTVTGPDGETVTAYDAQHERDLHLIVVRRDLTGFQHVHPTLDEVTGTWSVPVELTPGAWRVIADFTPAGADPLVLGTDLLVPGRLALAPEPTEARVSVSGAYQGVLNGEVAVGETALTLTLSRAGRPITDLQPYLGAYGHLVAVRAGDLGYLHVHPDEDTGPGPDLVFHTEFPSDGVYRLFLDVRHRGRVITLPFTVEVGEVHSHEH